MIAQETATVYWGGGRRWLSLRAAAKAEARRIIREKRCECDDGDEVTPAYVCEMHLDLERYVRLRDRVARILMSQTRRAYRDDSVPFFS